MWRLENGLQVAAFLTCVCFGAIYCFIYDILRAVRKNKRFSDFSVAVQDICYFVFTALITFLLFLKFTFGEIRLYIFIALGLGFCLFRLTLSGFITPVLTKIIGVLIGFLATALRGLKAVQNKIGGILGRYTEKMKKYYKIRLKNLKNLLQHSH